MLFLADTWFNSLIRIFFFNIDKVIYGFIGLLYDFLLKISSVSVFSQADIMSMADRLYKLLAIFMVFKVTFSLITYVVNPDDFSDKNKGVGKLTLNIILSLALLILTPYAFNMAYNLQSMVLKENSLATIVFGEQGGNSVENNYFSTAGSKMQFDTFSPFFTPNLSIDGLIPCSELIEDRSSERVFNSKCSEALLTATGNEALITNYAAGVEHSSFGLAFRQNLVTATDSKGEYIMDYKIVLSTVAGVIVVILLITFSMDIALRSIKLAFYQLIAPIPIISLVDPKSGKDGIFKKWYQACFKTFLSLFIRLLALYFGVFIITKVDGMVNIVDGSYEANGLIKVFVVIGALMFAKQLPKILEGLGIKLDGDGKFFLNPIKKFEEQALGGKRFTGAAGALVSGLADRGARIVTAQGAKGKLSALAGTAPGLLGAAKRGFSSNAGFKGGMDSQSQFNRRLREGRTKGLSPTAAYLDYFGSKFGLDNATLEKEGTLVRKNDDNIKDGHRVISSQTRDREFNITAIKQSEAPVKSLQSRRNDVKKSADKLMEAAEAFASKKADVMLDPTREKINNQKLNAIRKLRAGDILDKNDIDILNSEGIGLRTSTADLLKKEREINKHKYTTNRRADEANVQFLNDNQGKVLSQDIVIGEGASQVVLKEGTYIDGNIVARAKDAQGRYIKASKEAVYNNLSAGNVYVKRDSDGNAKTDASGNFVMVDEQYAFNSDSNEYNKAKEVANNEIDDYNNKHKTSFAKFKTDVYSFEDADNTSNTIKSGDDTSEINNEIRRYDSEIEKITREIEEIKNKQIVDYYDEHGKRIKISLQKAESLNKEREELYKKLFNKHQERLALLQAMANKK